MKLQKKNLGIKIFGWIGLIALLLGFALLTFGFTDSKSIFYLGLNIFGAAGIAADAWIHRDSAQSRWSLKKRIVSFMA